MLPHVILINGIRTPTTAASWPKRLGPYLETRYRCTTEAHYYRTGPIPPWNFWVTNPRIARTLGNAIEERMNEVGNHPLHIVAHSNGTNIAVSLARALADRDIKVGTMVLIASALHSDIERSGLGPLISAGDVHRAIAYCSPDDLVVGRLQSIPGFYGSLGSRGFEWQGGAIGLSVAGYQRLEGEWGNAKHRYVTRWFPGAGHSELLEPEARAATFACIGGDLGLKAA